MHRRSLQILHGLALFAAIAVLLSMSRAAAHDVSQAWDSGYYHLPFAARLGGILSPSEYAFGPENQARFDGFPLLGELLQGILWRISTVPQGANFVALSSVPLLALATRRLARATMHEARCAVPWSAMVLSCLGIPLVMTHATSTYVDLPASAALSIAFCRVLLLPGARLLTPNEAVRVMLLLAMSANMRLQHLPIALFVLVFFAVRYVTSEAPRRRAVVLLVCGLLPLVFAAPLKNLVLRGNPVYPVEISLFGHALPFVETRYSSSPVWLAHAPQPVRWLLSILEVGLPPWSDARRYSIDQWTPPDHPGYRMGGTLGFGMVLMLALFAFGAWKHAARRRIFIAFGAFTLVTAMMPQSHELRYTLYWPLSLCALAFSLGYARAPRISLGVSLLLPAIVIAITKAAWIAPGGSTFPELLAKKVDHARIDGIPDGSTFCVSSPPWDLLYAAKFHGRRYSVREAAADGTCASTDVRSASARTASSSFR